MIIMDTHVLIWLTEGNNRLGEQAKSEIDTAFQENELAISAISFWEIAMLAQKRRVELSLDISHWRKEILGFGLREIPVSGSIGIKATELIDFHGDPADRIIVATALRKSAILLTADREIIECGSDCQRRDARL